MEVNIAKQVFLQKLFRRNIDNFGKYQRPTVGLTGLQRKSVYFEQA